MPAFVGAFFGAAGGFAYQFLYSLSNTLSVTHAKLLRHGGEAWVGSPQLQSPHNGGREQVNIYPADAAPVQIPIPNERDHLVMRNDARLLHLPISSQELPAASAIADEKLSNI